MSGPAVEALADDAWLVVFGETDDPRHNDRVHGLAAALRQARPSWLRELVPAYASLGVFLGSASDADQAKRCLLDLCARPVNAEARHPQLVEVPVCYGGKHGPDLADAAAELGLSAEALAERHCRGDYTVAMIGFAPGFPYLSGLDRDLSLARLATPRTAVPAGSVAIGGTQTGIYPRSGPGGWRLLGRTPLTLFDPAADPPARLQPGDRVRFRRVDQATFARLARP